MNKNLFQSSACLSAFLCIIVMHGCGYGELSPEGYASAKALYSACNLKSEPRLQKIEAHVEQAVSENEMTDQEAAWIRDVIAMARDSQWEEATSAARQMMQDQVH